MARIKKKISSDFTVVHNDFLRNPKLGIAARGLLMTMIQIPEYTSDGKPWNFTIKGLSSNLPDGKQRVETALENMRECGYLMYRQITDHGRFVDLEYIFSDEVMPEAIEAYKKEKEQKLRRKKAKELAKQLEKSMQCDENSETENTQPEKPQPENRDTEKPAPKKSDGNKIKKEKILSEKISSDKISINQSYTTPVNFENQTFSDSIDEIDFEKPSREDVDFLIRENIEYDWYQDFFANHPTGSFERGENSTFAENLEQVDMLVDIIVDCICSGREDVRIGGQQFCHSVVESRFKKLNQTHIEYVFKSLMLTTTTIKNPKAYLLTALYNAPLTCDFMQSTDLKNLDPALFIPKEFHDEKFKEKYYGSTMFRG